MMILKNATIVTAENEAVGTVIIDNGVITDVFFKDTEDYDFRLFKALKAEADIIDLEGKWLMAGGIDAHVHFREPGLTHKADIYTESRAAVAGGVTTVFDMPNTNPATVTAEALKEKLELAEGRSVANISFHIGATNANADMICSLINNGDTEPGVKSDDVPGV